LYSEVLGQLISPVFKCQAVNEERQAIGGHIIIYIYEMEWEVTGSWGILLGLNDP